MIPFIALSFKPIVFIVGLVLGSFINVVALRYSGAGRLFKFAGPKRSHCPHCGNILRWYELIPVASFFLQLGRCRQCRHKLSWQYPIMELASGFAMLLIFYLPGPTGIIWALAALAMILLSAIDWRLQIIPDQINLFLAGLGIILGLLGAGSFLENYAPLFSLTSNALLSRLMAAIAAVIFFGFIIAVSRGRAMGVGDLKLSGALGLLLGWPDIVLSLSFSFIIGAFIGLVLLILNRKKLKSVIPFGPFLVGGVFLHILFGYQVVKWYFSISLIN